MNSQHNRFFLHEFSDLESTNFDIRKYSDLKFGKLSAANDFGKDLAEAFF